MPSDELRIELEPAGDDRWQAGGVSGTSSARHVFSLPFSPEELSWLSRPGFPFFRESTRRGCGLALEDVGERLFTTLFQGELRDLYLLNRVRSRDLTLRLCFATKRGVLNPLLALPWEALRDPDQGYLWRQWPALTVVRSLVSISSRHDPVVVDRAKVLLVEGAGGDLDLTAERKVVEATAGRSGRLHVSWAHCGELSDLRQALLDVRPHVLHFMGHGLFADEVGRLVFGPDQAVVAEVFADQFAGVADLRLVVVNACEGGRFPAAPHVSPHAGVAATVARLGVPAVVAMQYPVRDALAVAFSRGFYSALGREGDVVAAVEEGRRSILACREDSLEWISPICLDSGGSLFEWQSPSVDTRPRVKALWPFLLAGVCLGGAGALFAQFAGLQDRSMTSWDYGILWLSCLAAVGGGAVGLRGWTTTAETIRRQGLFWFSVASILTALTLFFIGLI